MVNCKYVDFHALSKNNLRSNINIQSSMRFAVKIGIPPCRSEFKEHISKHLEHSVFELKIKWSVLFW